MVLNDVLRDSLVLEYTYIIGVVSDEYFSSGANILTLKIRPNPENKELDMKDNTLSDVQSWNFISFISKSKQVKKPL